MRVVSVLLITAFINQDICLAQGGSPAWVKQAGVVPYETKASDAGVSLPGSTAVAKETFKAAGGKTIFNIQDAHASLGAQESIASILDSLVSGYDVRVIAVEGSSGYIDTSVAEAVADPRMREATARHFMENGRMSAGAFFSITSGKGVSLYGVDDAPLYTENLEQYRQVYEAAVSVLPDIDNLLSELKGLRGAVYSPELIRFADSAAAHRAGEISFAEHWKLVKELGGRAGLDHAKYPSLARLVRSLEMEKGIDFGKANRERDALIDELSKRMTKKDLEGLVVRSVAFKSGNISQGQFYSYLNDRAASLRLDPASYRSLVAFTAYITLYESIDLAGIFDEIASYEDEIFGNLLANGEARGLQETIRCAELLKSLFGLTLTRRDFGCLERLLSGRDARTVASFIREASAWHDIRLQGNYDIGRIFDAAPAARAFYRTAESRNDAMIANTIRRMEEEGQDAAALVTGGYHSTGIADILRRKETSYVVIMPKFDASKGDRPYVAILTNRAAPYENLLKSGQYYIAAQEYLNGVSLLVTAANGAAGAERQRLEAELAARLADVVIANVAQSATGIAGVDEARARLRRDLRVNRPRAVESTRRGVDDVVNAYGRIIAAKRFPEGYAPLAPERLRAIVARVISGYAEIAEAELAGEAVAPVPESASASPVTGAAETRVTSAAVLPDITTVLGDLSSAQESAWTDVEGAVFRDALAMIEAALDRGKGVTDADMRDSLARAARRKGLNWSAEADRLSGPVISRLRDALGRLAEEEELRVATQAAIEAEKAAAIAQQPARSAPTPSEKIEPTAPGAYSIETSGLKRAAVRAAAIAIVSAALAYSFRDAAAAPVVLGIAAGYFAAVTAFSLITRRYIARALGTRAGPIAWTQATPDGAKRIAVAPEFAKLPPFIQQLVLLHERTHLHTAAFLSGETAAYYLPSLGLYKDIDGSIPGVSIRPFTLSHVAKLALPAALVIAAIQLAGLDSAGGDLVAMGIGTALFTEGQTHKLDEYHDQLFIQRRKLLKESISGLSGKIGDDAANLLTNAVEGMPQEHIALSSVERLIKELAGMYVLYKQAVTAAAADASYFYAYNASDTGHTEIILFGKMTTDFTDAVHATVRAAEPSAKFESEWGYTDPVSQFGVKVLEVSVRRDGIDLALSTESGQGLDAVRRALIDSKLHHVDGGRALASDAELSRVVGRAVAKMLRAVPTEIPIPSAMSPDVMLLTVKQVKAIVNHNTIITEEIITDRDTPRQREAKIYRQMQKLETALANALLKRDPPDEFVREVGRIEREAIVMLRERRANVLFTFRKGMKRYMKALTDAGRSADADMAHAIMESVSKEIEGYTYLTSAAEVQKELKRFRQVVRSIRANLTYRKKTAVNPDAKAVCGALEALLDYELAPSVETFITTQKKRGYLELLAKARSTGPKVQRALKKIAGVRSDRSLSPAEAVGRTKVLDGLVDSYYFTIEVLRMFHSAGYRLPTTTTYVENERRDARQAIDDINAALDEDMRLHMHGFLAEASARLGELIVPGGETATQLFDAIADEYVRSHPGEEQYVNHANALFTFFMEGMNVPTYGDGQENAFYVADAMDQQHYARLLARNPRLAAVGSATGNSRSHWAITAKDMIVPGRENGVIIIPGIAELDRLSDGDTVIIDGRNKRMIVNPASNPAIMQYYRGIMQREQILRRIFRSKALETAVSADRKEADRRIVPVLADVPKINPDAVLSHRFGSEGVGLIRMENYYTGTHEPKEEDLAREAVVAADQIRGWISFRMLDIQEDKLGDMLAIREKVERERMAGGKLTKLKEGVLFYFETETGKRIFARDLRALMIAYARSRKKNIRILIPNVENEDQAQQLKARVDEIRQSVVADTALGVAPADLDGLRFVAMIEWPGACTSVKEILATGLFSGISFGTNDLSRRSLSPGYARDDAQLERVFQRLMPLFLRNVETAIRSVDELNASLPEGGRYDIYACGEWANSPKFVLYLLGLMFTYKNVTISPVAGSYSIAELKEVIRNVSAEEAHTASQGDAEAGLSALAAAVAGRINERYDVAKEIERQIMAEQTDRAAPAQSAPAAAASVMPVRPQPQAPAQAVAEAPAAAAPETVSAAPTAAGDMKRVTVSLKVVAELGLHVRPAGLVYKALSGKKPDDKRRVKDEDILDKDNDFRADPRFQSPVTVTIDGVTRKSAGIDTLEAPEGGDGSFGIFNLMGLGAVQGDVVKLTIEGNHPEWFVDNVLLNLQDASESSTTGLPAGRLFEEEPGTRVTEPIPAAQAFTAAGLIASGAVVAAATVASVWSGLIGLDGGTGLGYFVLAAGALVAITYLTIGSITALLVSRDGPVGSLLEYFKNLGIIRAGPYPLHEDLMNGIPTPDVKYAEIIDGELHVNPENLKRLPLWIQSIIARHEELHRLGLDLSARYRLPGRIAGSELLATPAAPAWALIVRASGIVGAIHARVVARTGFIIGVPSETSAWKFQELQGAVGSNAVLHRARAEVRAYKTFDDFNTDIKGNNVHGVFIDASYLDTVGVYSLVANLTISASHVLIARRTRQELQRIIAEIKAILPDVVPASPGQAFILHKKRAEMPALRGKLLHALIAHMSEISPYYNGFSRERFAKGVAEIDKPAVAALTEEVVANDIFSAANMDAIRQKNAGVTACFIYGTGRLKTRAEAAAFLKSMNYSEATIGRMKFVNGAGADGRPMAYSAVVAAIAAETGVEASRIGVAAVDSLFTGTLAKKETDNGILLEVGAVQSSDGRPFYATMNTIQTLISILAQLDGSTLRLDNPVPDVVSDSVRGVFRYLPRAVPIDYNKELEIFKEAVRLIRTAA